MGAFREEKGLLIGWPACLFLDLGQAELNRRTSYRRLPCVAD